MNRSGGIAALALGTALLAGCGVLPGVQAAPGGGTGRNNTGLPTRTDPNSLAAHPLGNLSSDLVFASLPPGSTKTGEQKMPAHNDPIIFGSGGTFGAGYRIDFTSTAPPSDVYTDLDRRARAAGWLAVGKDRDGRTAHWAKAYPDGSGADLTIERHDPEKASPPYRYSLNASI